MKNMFVRLSAFAALSAVIVLTSGCISGNFKLFTTAADPLKEYTLEGSALDKILVIPITGTIKTSSEGNFIRSKPSVVQDVVSQLSLAERDRYVKGVLILVNSPGGTVTASDMLYEEIRRFRERSGKKVVVCMMDMAASGGYYISLPADLIYAHPTTITGSVGVIFMRPEFYGLMGKIGVDVKTDKSGVYKDMGSPFRAPSKEDDELFKKLVSDMAVKFTDKVRYHRKKITPENMKEVATARIFLADEALKLGLIDRIGYIDDAAAETKEISGASKYARLVVYRRDEFHNDNIYNMSSSTDSTKPLVDTGIIGQAAGMSSGFYYLWPAVVP